MEMKELFIDTETSGLSPYKNGVIQIAAIFCINGKEVKTFESGINIISTDKIEEAALKANGITREQITNFPEAKVVYSEFLAILDNYIDKFDKSDKFIFYGYNGRFDYDFLRAWFEKVGKNKFFGSYVHFPPIDIMNLAIDHLKEERHTMPNFKQGTVAEKLGIEIDESKLHDALYDIELAKQIYDKVRSTNGR
jgi:DNA polymerase-3 subunit epsilon